MTCRLSREIGMAESPGRGPGLVATLRCLFRSRIDQRHLRDVPEISSLLRVVAQP